MISVKSDNSRKEWTIANNTVISFKQSTMKSDHSNQEKESTSKPEKKIMKKTLNDSTIIKPFVQSLERKKKTFSLPLQLRIREGNGKPKMTSSLICQSEEKISLNERQLVVPKKKREITNDEQLEIQESSGNESNDIKLVVSNTKRCSAAEKKVSQPNNESIIGTRSRKRLMQSQQQAAARQRCQNSGICLFCNNSNPIESLFSCIECGKKAHSLCLNPPQPQIPSYPWRCPKCLQLKNKRLNLIPGTRSVGTQTDDRASHYIADEHRNWLPLRLRNKPNSADVLAPKPRIRTLPPPTTPKLIVGDPIILPNGAVVPVRYSIGGTPIWFSDDEDTDIQQNLLPLGQTAPNGEAYDRKCENCSIIHPGTFGAGRFCSSKCAKSIRGISRNKPFLNVNDNSDLLSEFVVPIRNIRTPDPDQPVDTKNLNDSNKRVEVRKPTEVTKSTEVRKRARSNKFSELNGSLESNQRVTSGKNQTTKPPDSQKALKSNEPTPDFNSTEKRRNLGSGNKPKELSNPSKVEKRGEMKRRHIPTKRLLSSEPIEMATARGADNKSLGLPPPSAVSKSNKRSEPNNSSEFAQATEGIASDEKSINRGRGHGKGRVRARSHTHTNVVGGKVHGKGQIGTGANPVSANGADDTRETNDAPDFELSKAPSVQATRVKKDQSSVLPIPILRLIRRQDEGGKIEVQRILAHSRKSSTSKKSAKITPVVTKEKSKQFGSSLTNGGKLKDEEMAKRHELMSSTLRAAILEGTSKKEDTKPSGEKKDTTEKAAKTQHAQTNGEVLQPIRKSKRPRKRKSHRFIEESDSNDKKTEGNGSNSSSAARARKRSKISTDANSGKASTEPKKEVINGYPAMGDVSSEKNELKIVRTIATKKQIDHSKRPGKGYKFCHQCKELIANRRFYCEKCGTENPSARRIPKADAAEKGDSENTAKPLDMEILEKDEANETEKSDVITEEDRILMETYSYNTVTDLIRDRRKIETMESIKEEDRQRIEALLNKLIATDKAENAIAKD